MLKKMMLMAMSVGALIAFAAPAAQANVFLSEDGSKLIPGALVTASSTNLLIKQTGEGGVAVLCKKLTLHFEVIENGLEHVELEQTQTATSSDCKSGGVLPVTIDNGGVKQNLTIDTWGTGDVTSTFFSTVWLNGAHTVAGPQCDYEGSLHVEGLASGNNQLRVNKSLLTAAGCKAADIEGTLALETPGGAAVELTFVETPQKGRF